MPRICRDCANKECFNAESYGRVDYTEPVSLDEEDEIMDSDSMKYDDYQPEGIRYVECNECSSDNTDIVSQAEWEAWNGPENEETLPPEKQDDESWKDFLIRNNRKV